MKTKKSQQLVEFLFVAPFLIIILGILMEYAYALNINMTLAQELKTSVAYVYKEIKPGITTNDIRNIVTLNLRRALNENGISLRSENNLRVGYLTSGDVAVFTAEYTYIPSFTLPQIYFHFMPDQFNFFSTAAVSEAFLRSNEYDSINSEKLDSIWGASSFSNQDDFNDSKKGILKDISGRLNYVFLIYNTSSSVRALINSIESSSGASLYNAVKWDGSAIKSGDETYYVNAKNGRVYLCGYADTDGDGIKEMLYCNYNNMFVSFLTSLGYYNATFVDKAIADSGNYSSNWGGGISDLSGQGVSCLLKSTVALINSGFLSIGNYDYLDVSSYNPGVSAGNTYDMDSYGSMIFIHPSNINIDNVTSGSKPDYNYDFGSKVN